MIVLKNVTKNFGRTKVLAGISLTFKPGEFVCITGPSGAGKSTLLSLLIGAEVPSSGSVSIDGADLQSVPGPALQIFRRKVGMVFQDYKLLRNRTVRENIAFPLEVCGVPDAVIQKRTSELIKRMDLENRANALPNELSGGEKARAAIARALAHKPLVVLADEPTGNLDRGQAQKVMDLFKEIHRSGTTVIVATHDHSLLANAGVRVLTLSGGAIRSDGRKSVQHSPEVTIEKKEPAKPQPGKKPAEAVHSSKSRGPAKQTHRKIRITAIHSE